MTETKFTNNLNVFVFFIHNIFTYKSYISYSVKNILRNIIVP